jgi:hypothetical protein
VVLRGRWSRRCTDAAYNVVDGLEVDAVVVAKADAESLEQRAFVVEVVVVVDRDNVVNVEVPFDSRGAMEAVRGS